MQGGRNLGDGGEGPPLLLPGGAVLLGEGPGEGEPVVGKVVEVVEWDGEVRAEYVCLTIIDWLPG